MSETLEKTAPGQAEVRGGVTPYLMVQGAVRAGEFYQKAFGAQLASSYPPDDQGRTMHVHLYVNGGSLMLSDPYPEHGCPYEPATGFSLQLQVEDVDRWFQRAVDAGCEVVTPVQRMFWGARWGQLKDPFGVTWGIGTPD